MRRIEVVGLGTVAMLTVALIVVAGLDIGQRLSGGNSPAMLDEVASVPLEGPGESETALDHTADLDASERPIHIPQVYSPDDAPDSTYGGGGAGGFELAGSVVGEIHALDIDGGNLYVGVDNDLKIMSLAVPESPSDLGVVSVGSPIASLAVDGTKVYVVDAPGRLSVVDISNPAAPSVASTVVLSATGAVDILVDGDYLYVVDSDFGSRYGDSGLRIVDVSSPVSPTVTGLITWPDRSAADADLAGEFIAVGLSNDDETGNLEILQVQEPTLAGTVVTGTYVVGADVGGVEWISNTLYASASKPSAGEAYLDVINVSESSEPIRVGRYEYPDTSAVFPSAVSSLSVKPMLGLLHMLADSTVVTAERHYVIDPTLTGSNHPSFLPVLRRIDVRNPSAMSSLGSYTFAGDVLGIMEIVSYGEYVYVATGPTGLSILRALP